MPSTFALLSVSFSLSLVCYPSCYIFHHSLFLFLFFLAFILPFSAFNYSLSSLLFLFGLRSTLPGLSFSSLPLHIHLFTHLIDLPSSLQLFLTFNIPLKGFNPRFFPCSLLSILFPSHLLANILSLFLHLRPNFIIIVSLQRCNQCFLPSFLSILSSLAPSYPHSFPLPSPATVSLLASYLGSHVPCSRLKVSQLRGHLCTNTPGGRSVSGPPLLTQVCT